MLAQIECPSWHDEWILSKPNTYICRAVVCEDSEGGYYAYATRLPGVASQGDTFGEAVENLKEAFATALSCYLAAGEIPWQEAEQTELGVQINASVTVSLD